MTFCRLPLAKLPEEPGKGSQPLGDSSPLGIGKVLAILWIKFSEDGPNLVWTDDLGKRLLR